MKTNACIIQLGDAGLEMSVVIGSSPVAGV